MDLSSFSLRAKPRLYEVAIDRAGADPITLPVWDREAATELAELAAVYVAFSDLTGVRAVARCSDNACSRSIPRQRCPGHQVEQHPPVPHRRTGCDGERFFVEFGFDGREPIVLPVMDKTAAAHLSGLAADSVTFTFLEAIRGTELHRADCTCPRSPHPALPITDHLPGGPPRRVQPLDADEERSIAFTDGGLDPLLGQLAEAAIPYHLIYAPPHSRLAVGVDLPDGRVLLLLRSEDHPGAADCSDHQALTDPDGWDICLGHRNQDDDYDAELLHTNVTMRALLRIARLFLDGHRATDLASQNPPRDAQDIRTGDVVQFIFLGCHGGSELREAWVHSPVYTDPRLRIPQIDVRHRSGDPYPVDLARCVRVHPGRS